jgi:GT2 family glycosyltransferase
VDVELDGPLEPLAGLDGYGLALVVARRHGVPVGTVTVPVVAGRCSARRLAAALLDRHAETLLARLATDWIWSDPARRGAPDVAALLDSPPAPAVPAGPLPSVTLAVCTRDRPDDLARCLDAIAALRYDRLDVLVVDNAPSSEATAELVRGRYPWARYVREPRPGLDWARNRAILEARGELLAFTDDDVEVEPDWVRALARVFAEAPEVGCVTGLVIPAELETEAQRLFEKYGGFTRGFRRLWHRVEPLRLSRHARHHGAGQFGTGANMAFRRSLFDEIGGFDPALDVGTATNGGGDLEMFFRVLQEGYALVYEPAAVVRHRHRREYPALRHQLRQWGMGFVGYVARSAVAYPRELPAFLALMRWWWTGYMAGRVARSLLGRRSGLPLELLRGEMLGALAGLPRYGRAARAAAAIAAQYPDQPTFPTTPMPGHARRAVRRGAVAVRTAELHDLPRRVPGLDGYATALVYVTAGGRPVASESVPVAGDSIGALQMGDVLGAQVAHALLRHDRARALDALRAWLAPEAERAGWEGALGAAGEPAPPSLGATVVVATADRPDDLRRCLSALAEQRVRRDVEVIVVDNRPESGLTPPVVAGFPGVRLVREPRVGLSYARNAGFRAAQGDVLVSTDDDAIMPPEWLEAIVAPFARPDVMIVTGNVLPLELETRAQRLFELYGGLGRGFRRTEADRRWFDSYDRGAVETWLLGATANAAFRRTLLEHPDVGLLDEALGAGTPTACGEDTYLFYRALRAGFTSVYEPAAYVWHRHRRDMRALRRQLYGYTKGHVAYHLTTLVDDGDRRALPRLLRDLPRHHLSSALRWLFRDRRYPPSLILAEVAGLLAGPWAFWRSRARARRLGRSGPLSPLAPGAPAAEGLGDDAASPLAPPTSRAGRDAAPAQPASR